MVALEMMYSLQRVANFLMGGKGDDVYDLTDSKGPSTLFVKSNGSVIGFDPEKDTIVFHKVIADSIQLLKTKNSLEHCK